MLVYGWWCTRSACDPPTPSIAPRTRRALREAAERDMAAATALVAGKTSADQELATFYQEVLPAELDAARRLTYARCRRWRARPTSSSKSGDPTSTSSAQKNSRLGRLQTRIVLEGDYESLRQLLYELETTPEFLIVDDVALGSRTRTNR